MVSEKRLRRSGGCNVQIDGEVVDAFEGETVAALLLRLGRRALRLTLHRRELRGYFCGMSSCYDCLVRIDGRERPSCATAVAEGMHIETGVRTAP